MTNEDEILDKCFELVSHARAKIEKIVPVAINAYKKGTIGNFPDLCKACFRDVLHQTDNELANYGFSLNVDTAEICELFERFVLLDSTEIDYKELLQGVVTGWRVHVAGDFDFSLNPKEMNSSCLIRYWFATERIEKWLIEKEYIRQDRLVEFKRFYKLIVLEMAQRGISHDFKIVDCVSDLVLGDLVKYANEGFMDMVYVYSDLIDEWATKHFYISLTE